MHIVRRYPKLLGFLLSCVCAYALAHNGSFDWMVDHFNGHGYLSAFLGGMLYCFGFTAPFGVGILAAASPHVNPIPAAIIGGGGALIADMAIFSFASISLKEEIVRLSLSRMIQQVRGAVFHDRVNERMRTVSMWILASILIASPLPDEIGVTMLSSVTTLRSRPFAVLAYILNTLGILAIVLAAR